jgi:carbon monoxide dehydrogenase subunit G
VKVERTQRLAFPRELVWERLMDFDVLARSLPGVEAIEALDAETSRLVVKPVVPSITGTYEGTVTIVEKEPVASYRLRGEAKGRLGWVRGDSVFELREDDGGTEVTAAMTFQAGGTLSGVGQRFMEGIAKGMLRDFFAAFERELEATRAAAPA